MPARAPLDDTLLARASTDETAALDAIRRHGDLLASRLAELADAVSRAVADGEDGTTESLTLFSWYRGDLLPQFKAAEATVYARGRERETTALLVQALAADHGRLREIFESLDSVDGPGEAAATAGAAKVLYTAHLAKQSELLLPALANAGVSIAGLVADRPELAGGARKQAEIKAPVASGGGAPTIAPISGTEELDVRALPHQARHGVILGKMQALTATGALVLTNDHDPLPLKYQADAMWPDQFEWTYLDEGPDEWRVSIARI